MGFRYDVHIMILNIITKSHNQNPQTTLLMKLSSLLSGLSDFY